MDALMWLLRRQFRVVRTLNSWNLSGWVVQDWFPVCEQWATASRFYLTRGGAARCMARMREATDAEVVRMKPSRP